MRFQDKVSLVTGGGSGIGKAICQRLASEGSRITVVDFDAVHGQSTAQELTRSGGEAIFAQCDVSDDAQVQNAVKSTVDKWGRVDVLVNNAAMMTFQNAIDLKVSDWDRVIAVNLRSVFMFCHYCLPHMQRGAIVNISSVHAHQTEAGVSPYAASKGGVEAFTRALSRELEEPKVRANCVTPGAVDTPMLWNNPNVKSGKEKVEGAVGKPDDIAAAVAFLASDEARFITGANLIVDGGRLDIL